MVSIITRILGGQYLAISEIYTPEENLEQKYQKMDEQLKKEFIKVDYNDLDALEKYNEKIKTFIEKRKLNSQREAVDKYYAELQGMLRLNLVDSLPISEKDRVTDFFDGDSDFGKVLNKVL